ncbi:MAG TPA: sensor histidine kinase [Steroidobacteraceae bacterium]|jgi:two-component system CheB/CheR fusion protein|nr:sensor histidine kinase [Steroidobacteraceae bacterium]
MTAKEVADSAELRRRIRRLLSALRSIALDMQVRARGSHDSARHFAGRVNALGRAAMAPIAFGLDLESLVLDELLVHSIHHGGLAVSGPPVRLNAKSADVMSLAIHELATNSIKFGALSQPRTSLRVVWWFTGLSGARLHFEWAESGVRMAPSRRIRPGFGSQVVRRLIARELRGEGNMLFLSRGILCTIEFPAGEALLQND